MSQDISDFKRKNLKTNFLNHCFSLLYYLRYEKKKKKYKILSAESDASAQL